MNSNEALRNVYGPRAAAVGNAVGKKVRTRRMSPDDRKAMAETQVSSAWDKKSFRQENKVGWFRKGGEVSKLDIANEWAARWLGRGAVREEAKDIMRERKEARREIDVIKSHPTRNGLTQFRMDFARRVFVGGTAAYMAGSYALTGSALNFPEPVNDLRTYIATEAYQMIAPEDASELPAEIAEFPSSSTGDQTQPDTTPDGSDNPFLQD